MSTHTTQLAQELLGPLSQKYPQRADEILDLYDGIVQRKHPGECIRCFFQLSEVISEDALQTLKIWMEEEIEVVATDTRDELDRFPLQLQGNSMEDFCHNLTGVMRWDRPYKAPRIEVDFHYRELAHVES